MTLVSIIIPNYNHAAYLEKRLESVFYQTFEDFEVILLDDASTDHSREILSRYENHKKVSHCIYNEVNSGSPFKQWKKGIDLSNGRYIWIAESDDWAEPHFLESMVIHISDQVGLVACRSVTFDDDKGKYSSDFYPDTLDNHRWKHSFLVSGQDEINHFLVKRNTIPNASACLFDKQLASFDEQILSMKFCGDWLFWAKILSQTNYYFTAEPLNYFRSSVNSSRSIKDPETEISRFNELCLCIDRIAALSTHKYLPAYWYDWLFPMKYSKRKFWRIPFHRKPIRQIRQWDFIRFLVKEWFLEAYRMIGMRRLNVAVPDN